MEVSFNRPHALFFDVNETLLDLSPVRKAVADALGGRPDLVSYWFNQTLQYTMYETVAERFHPLEEIGSACLQMIAAQHGIPLDQSVARAALAKMGQLSPHEDVIPALEALRAADVPLYALTNSASKTLRRQMDSAELTSFFEQLLSVEEIGLYKPHRYVYRWAARRVHLAPSAIMMVACHAWDVAGAQWVGMRSAFVERPGSVPFPLAEAPEIIQPDLIGVADYLLNLRRV